jgi:alkylhydroperoxidase/carboxymuconolactone decarboxylase family protein YurZ
LTENPLKIFEKLDSELFKLFESSRAFTFEDGTLSRKSKLLIALALDAAKGKAQGVKSLTQLAMQVGATIEEIMETLRVAFFVNGVGCIYTAAEAFRELF